MKEYRLPMLLANVAHGTTWEVADASDAEAELMPLGTSRKLAQLKDENARLNRWISVIRDLLGDELVVLEIQKAIENCDPEKYNHPDDIEYCEIMLPHLQGALEHFSEPAPSDETA